MGRLCCHRGFTKGIWVNHLQSNWVVAEHFATGEFLTACWDPVDFKIFLGVRKSFLRLSSSQPCSVNSCPSWLEDLNLHGARPEFLQQIFTVTRIPSLWISLSKAVRVCILSVKFRFSQKLCLFFSLFKKYLQHIFGCSAREDSIEW